MLWPTGTTSTLVHCAVTMWIARLTVVYLQFIHLSPKKYLPNFNNDTCGDGGRDTVWVESGGDGQIIRKKHQQKNRPISWYFKEKRFIYYKW